MVDKEYIIKDNIGNFVLKNSGGSICIKDTCNSNNYKIFIPKHYIPSLIKILKEMIYGISLSPKNGEIQINWK